MRNIPLFTSLRESTYRQIIQILGREPGLRVVDVRKRLRKRYLNKISPQAVHKDVLKLVSAKILEQSNHRYNISAKWLEGMENFIFVNPRGNNRNRVVGALTCNFKRLVGY